MPELPDLTVYLEALEVRVLGKKLLGLRFASPFVLRSVSPPPEALFGRAPQKLSRLGKRLIFDFGDELLLALHLMKAGRLRWLDAGAKMPGRIGVAAFDFENGTLALTEAGTKKRAPIHVLQGKEAFNKLDAGGLELFAIDGKAFAARLRSERHTLKRSLTDPRMFAGIGNAYSDEILHRARLSPLMLSTNLDDEQMKRLWSATRAVMKEWTERLREQTGDGFPKEVTAFRQEMAVHGRYKQPCPDCGTPVQRIVYAENETNYCPRCQTEGRLLADRSLSRLLKDDWPRTIEELEQKRGGA